MNAGFIGLIKLTDKSEIIGEIKFRTEDFSDGIIISNPLIIHEEIVETHHGGEVVKVEMKPWCKFSSESSFFIDRCNIITIGEADTKITSIYRKSIRKYMNINSLNQVKLDSGYGYVSKIDEAKKKLNQIFYSKHSKPIDPSSDSI